MVLAEAARLRAEGRSLIAMHAGEPDFDTPSTIVEAGATALRAGQTRYAPTAGVPALREAVVTYMQSTRGLAITPDQVVIAPGAKPLIYFALLALCEAGDEVICPEPGYPIYAFARQLCRGHAGFSADDARERLLTRPGSVASIDHAAHTPDRAQLAFKPHGWHFGPPRIGGCGRAGAGARPFCFVRRDLQPKSSMTARLKASPACPVWRRAPCWWMAFQKPMP